MDNTCLNDVLANGETLNTKEKYKNEKSIHIRRTINSDTSIFDIKFSAVIFAQGTWNCISMTLKVLKNAVLGPEIELGWDNRRVKSLSEWVWQEQHLNQNIKKSVHHKHNKNNTKNIGKIDVGDLT